MLTNSGSRGQLWGGGCTVGLAVAAATTWAPRTRLRPRPAEAALGPRAMGPPTGPGSVFSHLLKQGLPGPVQVSRHR